MQTALHKACRLNQTTEKLKMLLDAGAVTWLEDYNGKTALDIAIARKNQEFIDLLS
jgi:ankyrin repeat protein